MDADEMQSDGPQIDFVPWDDNGALTRCSFDIGDVSYDVNGVLKLKLLSQGSVGAGDKQLVFDAPLAVRMTQEGSLMDYWNRGFIVHDHNIFVAEHSDFLAWLEHSSSGVHSAGRVKHYGIFTDDLCVEILSAIPPKIVPASGRV